MDLGKLDDCIKSGLIRKIEPSKETALKIMSKAVALIAEAKATLDADAPDATVLLAYDAMLLSAKALLTKDGFREKSHYCAIVYVEVKYADTDKIDKNLIKLFDNYRLVRHMAAYDTDFMMSEKDAKQSVRDAELISAAISKLI